MNTTFFRQTSVQPSLPTQLTHTREHTANWISFSPPRHYTHCTSSSVAAERSASERADAIVPNADVLIQIGRDITWVEEFIDHRRLMMTEATPHVAIWILDFWTWSMCADSGCHENKDRMLQIASPFFSFSTTKIWSVWRENTELTIALCVNTPWPTAATHTIAQTHTGDTVIICFLP